MTRIALIPSAYLPDLGGVEEMSHQLARSLIAAGDQVEVWTAKVPAVGPPVQSTIDGISVHRFAYPLPALGVGSLARSPVDSYRALRHLHQSVRRYRPDLLHVQCFGPNGVYATALSHLYHVPLVVTLHGELVTNDNDIFERSVLLRVALREAMRHSKAVTGCSAFALKDAFERFGLSKTKGQVVFNGIDLTLRSGTRSPGSRTAQARHASQDGAETKVDGAPEAIPSRTGTTAVVAIGRMVEMKGFDLLLEAFARVADDHPGAELILAGEGRALPALVEQAARLGLSERVQFPGRLDRGQVATLLSDASISVLPSRLESFGLVVLEAWQAGLPVIATTRGGPPEFVTDGIDGLLADPLDTSALAAALDRLLGDRQLCQRIGEAGRQRTLEFGWPAVADRYREIYARVLATSSR